MARIRFTLCRDVKYPNRAHEGDAGIDFFIPKLTKEDILAVKVNHEEFLRGKLQIRVDREGSKIIKTTVTLRDHGRILIPSGVRVLIEPINSMLMAANKSGVSTKDGLVYTAEIIDSPYTGEMHIGILNTSESPVSIDLAEQKKIVQFIHVPVLLTQPEYICPSEYEEIASTWGTRGADGFGSTDNQ